MSEGAHHRLAHQAACYAIQLRREWSSREGQPQLSRTDKTKPFWVKLAHGDLMVVEAHDHIAGPCDLPDPYDAFAFSRLTTRCRREFVYTGTSTCCCRMCRIVVDYPDRTERIAGAASAAGHVANCAAAGPITSWPADASDGVRRACRADVNAA